MANETKALSLRHAALERARNTVDEDAHTRAVTVPMDVYSRLIAIFAAQTA